MLFRSNTPLVKQAAAVIEATSLLGIRRSQQFVDVITWNAAYEQGLQFSKGDARKAAVHADGVVRRTQASEIGRASCRERV